MSVITKEIKARMVADSPLNQAKAEKIAEEFGISSRAVIASATRSKDVVYSRKERVSKDGSPVVKKEDLVEVLASRLSVSVDSLDGLNKATKNALEVLVEATKPSEVSDETETEES